VVRSKIEVCRRTTSALTCYCFAKKYRLSRRLKGTLCSVKKQKGIVREVLPIGKTRLRRRERSSLSKLCDAKTSTSFERRMARALVFRFRLTDEVLPGTEYPSVCYLFVPLRRHGVLSLKEKTKGRGTKYCPLYFSCRC
jgi:hypothetical protein